MRPRWIGVGPLMRKAGPLADGASGCDHDERCFDFVPGRALLAIRDLLEDDTECSPWERGKALQVDVLFASGADSKPTRIQAAESDSHLAQPAGITLQIAHRPVAIAGVLDSVQLLRAGVNRESLALPAGVFQFRSSVLQGHSERVQFSLCHSL